ncbi:MAG TPA: hypothetical protein VMD48_10365 [Solirubrobacteraceae bacterium]|nr:hypothetical protein [Solirubrobacteraceae bacterium]
MTGDGQRARPRDAAAIIATVRHGSASAPVSSIRRPTLGEQSGAREVEVAVEDPAVALGLGDVARRS